MKAEIIFIGNKLLSGDVVNVNAEFISSALLEADIECCGQTVVGGSFRSVKQEISHALSLSDVVLVCEGLDNSEDDAVKVAVREIFGIELAEDYGNGSSLCNTIILNDEISGSYAMAVEKGAKTIVLLPSSPAELKEILKNKVLPYLILKKNTAWASATISTFGISESSISDSLKEIANRKNTEITLLSNENTTDINVTVCHQSLERAKELCNDTVDKIRSIFGDAVFGINSNDLASVTVELLRKNKLKISTAESCTSGMLSALITSVPHSSEIFEMGISAYSLRIKQEALSVPSETLKKHGAISWQTAMYLAKNVRHLCDSDIGVGITGNAGPTADEDKPVGLIYVAIADKNGYYVKQLKLPPVYSRQKIRSYSAHVALDMVRLYAMSYPETPSQFIAFGTAPEFKEEKKEVKPIPVNAFVPMDEDEEEEIVFSNNAKPEPVIAPAEYNTFEDAMFDDDGKVIEDNEIFSSSVDKNPDTKPSFFASLLNKINPIKSNGVKDIITKIVFIVSLVAFVVSAVVLGSHFITDKQQQNIIGDAREVYEKIVLSEADAPKLFDVLKKDNPDIKAWITIENTAIDHPIYQSQDNDFYLNHNMYKKRSRYGALFFDYRNSFDDENKSQNFTVYGHNMNNGSMFGTLTRYKSLSFYLDNPTFKVTTEDGFDQYAIFSVMVMNATAKDDNGYLYNFTRSSFSTAEEFDAWIAESLERSLLITNVSIDSDDEILTLVTCDVEKLTFENSRFVVMAKKLDDSDIYQTNFSAKLNPNPRYPQAWYDAKGLKGYSPDKDSDSTVSSTDTTSSENNSSIDDSSSNSDSSSSSNNSSTSTPSTGSSKPSTPSTPSTPNTPNTSSNPSTNSSSTVPTPSTPNTSSSAPVPSTPSSSTPDAPTPSEPDSSSSTENSSEIAGSTEDTSSAEEDVPTDISSDNSAELS